MPKKDARIHSNPRDVYTIYIYKLPLLDRQVKPTWVTVACPTDQE